MADVMLKKRVHRLEDLMAKLLVATAKTTREVDRLSFEMREFKGEMHEFKNEMHEFKNEMREFKDETRASHKKFREDMAASDKKFHEEMAASDKKFEQEMADSHKKFEEEMRIWKEEAKRSTEEHDKKMQAIEAHHKQEMRKQNERFMRKMGTLVEDMVAPSIPGILHTMFGCSKDGLDFLSVRMKRRHPVTGKNREFDAASAFGEYLCINETKSRLNANDIKDFVEKSLPEARAFFPEYADRKVIGIISSFYVDESVLSHAERQGLIVLGMGDETMDILNSPGFLPKHY